MAPNSFKDTEISLDSAENSQKVRRLEQQTGLNDERLLTPTSKQKTGNYPSASHRDQKSQNKDVARNRKKTRGSDENPRDAVSNRR